MDLSMIPWGTLGPSGLLAVCVGMILAGRLVPRSALLDAHAERDRWRELAQAAVIQNHELLHGARVARDVLRALPEPAREPSS
jgi:hypothetical protein